MKYMLMMFGSSEAMLGTADPAWVKEMIGHMIQIDKDLRDSGESQHVTNVLAEYS